MPFPEYTSKNPETRLAFASKLVTQFCRDTYPWFLNLEEQVNNMNSPPNPFRPLSIRYIFKFYPSPAQVQRTNWQRLTQENSRALSEYFPMVGTKVEFNIKPTASNPQEPQESVGIELDCFPNAYYSNSDQRIAQTNYRYSLTSPAEKLIPQTWQGSDFTPITQPLLKIIQAHLFSQRQSPYLSTETNVHVHFREFDFPPGYFKKSLSPEEFKTVAENIESFLANRALLTFNS